MSVPCIQITTLVTSASADGSYCLGGRMDETYGAQVNAGAVYVWVRNGSSWSQQAKLGLPDAAANDQLGAGVALSADGSLAWAGAPGRNLTRLPGAAQGAVFAWRRTGTTWTLVASMSAAGASGLGRAVALAADGAHGFAGAPGTVRQI